jgi:hypothetical protein
MVAHAERRRLANRREAATFDIECAGLRYKVSIGHFPDGTLGEVFVSNHKSGNASDFAARDAGILVSLCLQHRVPLTTIHRALSKNADGSAAGVIGAVIDRIIAEQKSS